MLSLVKKQRSWGSRFFRGFSVWSFGDGSNGALGLDSPMLDAYEPSRVSALPESAVGVAAGHYHSLAVTAEGEIWAWGRNEEGQLGRGGVSPRETWRKPEKVIGLDHVKVQAAFASGVVSAAVGDDGSLWVWGRSKRGQLGLGKGVVEAIFPSKVEALSRLDITKISFGWGHALALTKEGKMFGWGYAEDGRLGHMGRALNTTTTQLPRGHELLEKSTLLEVVDKLVAEKIAEEDNMPIIWEPSMVTEQNCLNVSDIACGLDHSLVLCCDGRLLSFGNNTYGQLGRNTKGFEILSPNVNFHPLSVSAGLGHSLVLGRISSHEDAKEATAVLSWGWNRSYQLGRQGLETVPGLVEGLEGERVVSISAGRVHSIALTSKGEVWSWGSGRNGRLGLGSSADEMEPALVESLDGSEVLRAVAGFDHNLLLVAD